jgi:hypothetical protein
LFGVCGQRVRSNFAVSANTVGMRCFKTFGAQCFFDFLQKKHLKKQLPPKGFKTVVSFRRNRYLCVFKLNLS